MSFNQAVGNLRAFTGGKLNPRKLFVYASSRMNTSEKDIRIAMA